jgi:hypothetical protein
MLHGLTSHQSSARLFDLLAQSLANERHSSALIFQMYHVVWRVELRSRWWRSGPVLQDGVTGSATMLVVIGSSATYISCEIFQNIGFQWHFHVDCADDVS